jgi:hypothetical protein
MSRLLTQSTFVSFSIKVDCRAQKAHGDFKQRESSYGELGTQKSLEVLEPLAIGWASEMVGTAELAHLGR